MGFFDQRGKPAIEPAPYTVKDAANAIGVTRRTIYRWIAEGTIRPRRTPKGNCRFTKTEIENLAKKPGRTL